eukprot:UN21972
MSTTEYAKICNSQINSSRFIVENNKSTKFFKLFLILLQSIIVCIQSLLKFYSKKI